MTYLERLIDRATDRNRDLGNNQIGNYKISTQDGVNVDVYTIYKNNEHLFSIDIDYIDVIIRYNSKLNYKADLEKVLATISKIYSEHNVEVYSI